MTFQIEFEYSQNRLTEARAELARAAVEDTARPYYYLADAANAVAFQEGRKYVLAALSEVEAYDLTRLGLEWRYLHRTSLDDTWSGRTGDIRRSYYAGVHDALKDAEHKIFGRN